MSKSTFTEKELNEALCYDLSIQTLPNRKDVLILICKEKEGSGKLMDILSHNAFDLKIMVDEKTGKYSLEFDFIDSDMGFRFDSGIDEKSYPPIIKLKTNQIKFITTGVWLGKSKQGRACEYLPPMRLGRFDAGKSFSQANEVQFIPGDSDEEPSLILLIYNDYDHIFETEADESYNRLMKQTKGNPLLEIEPVDSEMVNLRIWDILIDLDIRFDGLKYSQEQMNNFLSKTDGKDSFAFALGFPPMGGAKGAIATTKREGFELIKLKGYAFKK